ncbi:N,N'-diacetylchitobiose phosphorylase [candidate division KSB1 bacterium]|nr:N,N'-diacetylchitobiose phosphorylase [candidate division KSB1 bacterium]
MQFGFFDDKNKEYVIDRPDTPRSWSNYLGDTTYGAIITNNAGGYSFMHSAAQGRFIRWRANTLPMDQPGRYFYLRDRESKDYWSASWQPVGKPLSEYKTTCRHGTAYTVIESDYNQIRSEATYFVPLGRAFECWHLKITNQDSKPRELSLFNFVEFSNFWELWQDWLNLQYSQYILQMTEVDGVIDAAINPLLPTVHGDFNADPQSRHSFITMVGAEITGFDTDRESFIGPYRGYGNPLVVEEGKCTGSLASGDNGCGVFQADLELASGESREVVVLMGIGTADVEGKAAAQEFKDLSKIQFELEKVKSHWHTRIQGMTASTPDPEFDSMMNMWSPYNSLITYSWSRAASLVYAGARDGLGYRDTVQDLLGVLHTIPEEAGERLELMITGQVSTGGAMPVVKPILHEPGKEKKPEESEYRSDDCYWLFNTVPAYVKETGDVEFYKKVLPYADEGEDTVLGHLKRAIQFSLDRSGSHGFPCGLLADWNDCLQLGFNGETIFVALQLRYALRTYIEICDFLKNSEESTWAAEHLKTLDINLNEHAWDGRWFRRAIREDGFIFGTAEVDEGDVWLNPQSWAVLSGLIQDEKGEAVMDVVHDRLATEYGLMILDPPYEKTDLAIIKSTLFNKGMKENGAIFCHTQGWVVIAEAMLGRGDRAFEYLRASMPSAMNTKAEIRGIEPYVNCQSTHSKYSPRFGASRLPWLSGSATWSYFAATQYILGIRPEYNGLLIDPCIPKDWSDFSISRRFRGKMLDITIQNPNGMNRGVKEIILNGNKIEGQLIPVELMESSNTVKVLLG